VSPGRRRDALGSCLAVAGVWHRSRVDDAPGIGAVRGGRRDPADLERALLDGLPVGLFARTTPECTRDTRTHPEARPRRVDEHVCRLCRDITLYHLELHTPVWLTR
jgi:hypothetical protein